MDYGKIESPLYDPSAPEYRRSLWVRLEGPDGRVVVVFLWRRIAVVLATLALCGWFASIGAVYVFLRVRHDFAAASYLNLAWPPRWSLHRQALGQHYIRRGEAALATGHVTDAAYLFGAGIARDPRNTPARRQLAVIYLRFGQVPAGLNLLAAGLEYEHDNLDYLKFTFGLLDEMREDARILALTQQYLPAVPDGVLTHQFLALQAATVNFRQGNYDAVERLVRDWQLQRSLEGQLLLAQCDWERGYPDLAVLRLEQQRETFPNRDELSLQLIRFYRALGHHTQALNEALLRHIADPASPGPRIDLMHAWQQNKDTTRLDLEIETYLTDFAADPHAIEMLAWFAADTGNVGLARRLHRLAASQVLSMTTYELVLAQSLITQSEHRAALEAVAAALTGPCGQDSRTAALLAGLRAVAAFGAGDSSNGEAYLQTFLLQERLHASDALLLSRRLGVVGATAQARRLLTAAVRKEPENQAALTELVHLEAIAANQSALEEYVPRLLHMSKPSRTILQEAAAALDGSTESRAALRVAIRTRLEMITATPAPG